MPLPCATSTLLCLSTHTLVQCFNASLALQLFSHHGHDGKPASHLQMTLLTTTCQEKWQYLVCRKLQIAKIKITDKMSLRKRFDSVLQPQQLATQRGMFLCGNVETCLPFGLHHIPEFTSLLLTGSIPVQKPRAQIQNKIT